MVKLHAFCEDDPIIPFLKKYVFVDIGVFSCIHMYMAEYVGYSLRINYLWIDIEDCLYYDLLVDGKLVVSVSLRTKADNVLFVRKCEEIIYQLGKNPRR